MAYDISRPILRRIERLHGERHSDSEIAGAIGGYSGREVRAIRWENGLVSEGEKAAYAKQRRLLIGGLGASALVALVGGITHIVSSQLSSSAQLLEEAVNDLAKRQQYIDSIVSSVKPEYVLSVEYATPRITRMLDEYRITPPKESGAIVIGMEKGYRGDDIRPANDNDLGKGVKSKIYILDTIFKNYSQLPINSPISRKEFYEGQDIIARNLILNNGVHTAELFSKGIKDYPYASFQDQLGRARPQLYTQAITMLVHANEYHNLLKTDAMKNRRVRAHALRLREEVNNSFLLAAIAIQGMSDQFIEKFELDFHPQRLLSRRQ